MKNFLNLHQEMPTTKECFTAYGRTHGFAEVRNAMLSTVTKTPLHHRITVRGNMEQYNVRFLKNYHGDQLKRKSKNYVLTVNTI